MVSFCDSVEEEMAWGRTLTEEAAAHARSCERCGELAVQLAALDARVGRDLDLDAGVPPGFADRLMARLPPAALRAHPREGIAARLVRLTEERWVQIVLAHAGVAFTVTNLIRFVVSLLVPATSLGGGR